MSRDHERRRNERSSAKLLPLKRYAVTMTGLGDGVPRRRAIVVTRDVWTRLPLRWLTTECTANDATRAFTGRCRSSWSEKLS